MTSQQGLLLRIANITINLTADSPEMNLKVGGDIEKFLTEEREADVRVRASWGDLSKRICEKKLFDSGVLWQLYCDNESYLFRFALSPSDSLPYKTASFNHEFTTGEVILHPSYFDQNQHVYPLEYPLDELLITNFLAKGRGVEVHALGVVASGGDGYLFVGQSGAGKSTMARLWHRREGVKVLSDDRIILRKENKKIWLYGTPWHGEAGLATPHRAPLTALYFLRHGQENELVALKGTQAVGRLFASSFVPFYSPGGLKFTLQFLDEVVEAVPCYELRFMPDERVIELW